MIASALDDWAAVAGIVAAVAAAVGLAFVVVQLRQSTAAARASGTIQFQQAFRESREARHRLEFSFPVHEELLAELVAPVERQKFVSWKELSDLTDSETADAVAVRNALNDIAQYVADGVTIHRGRAQRARIHHLARETW